MTVLDVHAPPHLGDLARHELLEAEVEDCIGDDMLPVGHPLLVREATVREAVDRAQEASEFPTNELLAGVGEVPSDLSTPGIVAPAADAVT
jgi:hypothetical protein